jgi:hypothetical protein
MPIVDTAAMRQGMTYEVIFEDNTMRALDSLSEEQLEEIEENFNKYVVRRAARHVRGGGVRGVSPRQPEILAATRPGRVRVFRRGGFGGCRVSPRQPEILSATRPGAKGLRRGGFGGSPPDSPRFCPLFNEAGCGDFAGGGSGGLPPTARDSARICRRRAAAAWSLWGVPQKDAPSLRSPRPPLRSRPS